MKRHATILLFFALFFAVEILTAFREKSPTVDEAYHVFAGYTHLKWGDFRAAPEHPPLAKMLAEVEISLESLQALQQGELTGARFLTSSRAPLPE
ncbi:MAG TPA: hypothetical protein VGH16_15680 [Candidatus Binatia bacterium]|jgi:hypothetical protein